MLINEFRFPPAECASVEGLLAIGGDLSTEMLISAYRQGIFPWYSAGEPIQWWSPDPRMLLFPLQFRCSRSLQKSVRNKGFQLQIDTAFPSVIGQCAKPRNRETGTWITTEMDKAYQVLHRLGYAHSIETWQNGKLVGGLYGISLGNVFFGESMFCHESDASKFALFQLVLMMQNWPYAFVDCQIPSDHLISLGAKAIERSHFLAKLTLALQFPDRIGSWVGKDLKE